MHFLTATSPNIIFINVRCTASYIFAVSIVVLRFDKDPPVPIFRVSWGLRLGKFPSHFFFDTGSSVLYVLYCTVCTTYMYCTHNVLYSSRSRMVRRESSGAPKIDGCFLNTSTLHTSVLVYDKS